MTELYLRVRNREIEVIRHVRMSCLTLLEGEYSFGSGIVCAPVPAGLHET